MIHYKSKAEIELARGSALLVSHTLTELAKILRPGITTLHLDKLVGEFLKDNGAKPSFLGYNGYPFNSCISVNDVVVHGFPNERELRDGDVVSIDVGAYKNGFHGDHAYTFAIGDPGKAAADLIRITKESLYRGIEKAVSGNRVGDISFAIQDHTERKYGYGVVRELVGHGLGTKMHEEPQVPNYGRRGAGAKLREGLILAIEPMVILGRRDVFTDADGWTVKTVDHSVAVHFEHDVCVQKNKADILSNYAPIEAAERANQELFVSELVA